MSLKETKDAAQSKLFTSLLSTLRKADGSLSFNVSDLELEVKGDFNIGTELMIIEYIIDDIMEDGGLDFDDVIYMITGVHTLLRKEDIEKC